LLKCALIVRDSDFNLRGSAYHDGTGSWQVMSWSTLDFGDSQIPVRAPVAQMVCHGNRWIISHVTDLEMTSTSP
jgi:hypothetical protein